MHAFARSALVTLALLFSLGAPLASADQHGAAAPRTDADKARDATSKPDEVLAFFGVAPGMVVLDLFAGGGYFSEILGHAVGPNGRVHMHNNKAYLGFGGEDLEARIASGRLAASVTRYDREADAIDLPDDSVDLVLMVMTYHDLYFKTDGWDLDPDAFFAMLHRVLKPGGTLAIVDHAAAAGSGSARAQDLHRIDPEFARRDIEGRGFVFAGSSELLRNPSDQLEVSVFDPAVRGTTDRFVYRFSEP